MELIFVPYFPDCRLLPSQIVANWLGFVPEAPLRAYRNRVRHFLTLSAVVPGFEPGQTEPKPVVLPLHHTTIAL